MRVVGAESGTALPTRRRGFKVPLLTRLCSTWATGDTCSLTIGSPMDGARLFGMVNRECGAIVILCFPSSLVFDVPYSHCACAFKVRRPMCDHGRWTSMRGGSGDPW